jgi:hypothetical protein
MMTVIVSRSWNKNQEKVHAADVEITYFDPNVDRQSQILLRHVALEIYQLV